MTLKRAAVGADVEADIVNDIIDEIEAPFFSCDAANAQSISNATWTILAAAWGTPALNTGFTSFTSGALTIAKAGWYEVELQYSSATAGAVSRFGAQINKNSATVDTNSIAKLILASRIGVKVTKVVLLAAGDVLRPQCYQDSGGALGILATYETHFAVRYLRAT